MAYASLIGAEVKRKEDPRFITGAGRYVGDLKLPGMCYVALVRSPYPHARIRSIDSTVALYHPDVIAVVTGRDLIDQCNMLPIASAGEGGGGGKDAPAHSRYALSVDKVRYVGEPVAAVIASSPEIAADVVALVEVDWEPLPAAVDPLKALEPDAPVLFDDISNNIDHVAKRAAGDVDAAFASAFKVVRQRMFNQRLAGIPMECRAVTAAPDPTTNGLNIWTSTQTPHQVRGEIAQVLRLEENQVRVIAPDVGGGFGVKIGIYPEEALLGWLARRFDAPIQWIETRLENMIATTHGRAQVADVEAAVAEDGAVTALRMSISADLGAYPLAPILPDLTIMMGVGVYHIPNVDLQATCVYTNTTPVAAYRGAGRPEAIYYIERLMDLVADELEMDPAEVRRKNFIPPEAFPYKTPTRLTYDSGEYDKALTKALELAQYSALRAEQQQRRQDARATSLLGVGVACYVEMCGFGPFESAQVRVEPSGTVTVCTGISPHGQGTGTTFAQIVADQIGADFDKIIVKYGDTGMTPMGVGTMGSRSLAVGGTALVQATEKIRQKLQQIAAHMLEAAPDDIVLIEGRYQVRGAPDSALTFEQLAHRAYGGRLPADIDTGLDVTEFFRPPSLIYPFGAHVAVVEVDVETGEVSIRNYFSVDDCGPRISPMIVNGQVHGGLAQGMAQALLEELVYDENGQLLSGSLMDYAIPRADLFPRFTTDQTVTPTPINPLGVKGIGEAATIGSTPAIVNAVVDALSHLGIRHLDMPLRPEKIWQALQGR
jgi:carbon-monoxide dehydrogenase large subunit